MARPKKNLKFGAGLTMAKKGGANGSGGKEEKGKGGEKERKKGFQVGPAHAPRNAYLGKGELPISLMTIQEAHVQPKRSRMI